MKLNDRDPASATYIALTCGAPVVVIYFPSPDAREWTIAEANSFLSHDVPRLRTSDPSLAVGRPTHLVSLVPEDESWAVEQLQGLSGQLEAGREYPVVLFLLRDGPGQEALAYAPELASLLRGHDVDPEELAEVDPVAERAKFLRETGTTPEEWLSEWEAGKLTHDAGNEGISYWAKLLGKP